MPCQARSPGAVGTGCHAGRSARPSTVQGNYLPLLLLILVNGAFSMSAIAVVSSRKARLQRMVDDGVPGAA
jgi:hypothetical protein